MPFLLLFGISSYLLVGVILTYHTSLGRKYFAATQTRLLFLWILPAITIIFYCVVLFSIVLVDEILFGAKDENPGLEKLLNIH